MEALVLIDFTWGPTLSFKEGKVYDFAPLFFERLKKAGYVRETTKIIYEDSEPEVEQPDKPKEAMTKPAVTSGALSKKKKR